jgi:hypothetical protein
MGQLDRLPGEFPQDLSPTEKDFDSARTADDKLASQISRAASLRLTALLIVTVLLIIGSVQQDTLSGPGQVVAEITALQSSRIATENQNDLNPFIVLFQKPEWSETDILQAPPGSPSNDLDATSLVAVLNQKGEALRAKYDEVYGVRLSILGTDIRLDLRILILTLPVWLSAAYVYIQVLRYKHRALVAVLESRVGQAQSHHLTSLDLLLHGHPYQRNSFRRYPSVLYGFGFRLTCVLLVVAILTINWGTLGSTDELDWIFLVLNSFAALAILCWAYTYRVGKQLSRQVTATFHCSLPEPWVIIASKHLHSWFERSLWQTRPRMPLGIGSVLVIVTLFMSTSQISCGQRQTVLRLSSYEQNHKTSKSIQGTPPQPTKERPGYELVLGTATWPPAISFLFESADHLENSLGRWLYVGAQVLAIVTIIWSIATVWISKLRPIARYLFCASGVYSLFLIADYASKHLLGLYWSWLILWSTTILIWLAPWPQGQVAKRFRCRIRDTLALLYIPAVIASLTYLATVFTRLPGLAMLYIGVHLLTIGYMALARGAAKEHIAVRQQ